MIPHQSERPETYKSYKKKYFGKHIYKAENQFGQIKQCSLNVDDKKKLIDDIIKKFTDLKEKL